MMYKSIAKDCKIICMANFFKISFFYHHEVQVVVFFLLLQEWLCFAYNFHTNGRKYLWMVSFDRSFEELSECHQFFVVRLKNDHIMTCQSYCSGTGCCDFPYFAWMTLFSAQPLNESTKKPLIGLVWKIFEIRLWNLEKKKVGVPLEPSRTC